MVIGHGQVSRLLNLCTFISSVSSQYHGYPEPSQQYAKKPTHTKSRLDNSREKKTTYTTTVTQNHTTKAQTSPPKLLIF
jgi:hypothetical protein